MVKVLAELVGSPEPMVVGRADSATGGSHAGPLHQKCDDHPGRLCRRGERGAHPRELPSHEKAPPGKKSLERTLR